MREMERREMARRSVETERERWRGVRTYDDGFTTRPGRFSDHYY